MKRMIANIICCCVLFFSAAAQNIKQITADKNWKDDAGNFINAHGAGVLFFNDTYYLFGEIKKGKTRLVPNQSWEDYRVDAGGISCYSSKDLLNWKYEGIALVPDKNDTASDININKVIERPKVIYNDRTKQFVMWMHIDKEDYSYARAGVAVGNNPQGPYKFLRSVRPNNQMARDMTLFKDNDGKAYLVYASENNNTMQICLLSDDYLSPAKKFIRIFENERREAPAMFKHGGKYYLITSLCSGWDPNAALYATADSIMGEWKQQGNPCVGADSATTFHSQSTFVLPLANKKNELIFMADRWNKLDLEASQYLWLPLFIKDEKVEIKPADEK
jgi:glycosyl hydrolase family 43